MRNAIILQQKKTPIAAGRVLAAVRKNIFLLPLYCTRREKKNQLNRGLAQLQFSTRFRVAVLKCIELCNCVCVCVPIGLNHPTSSVKNRENREIQQAPTRAD